MPWTIAELEAQVGAKPSAIDLKVIDHMDEHARRWLRASPLGFAGFSDAQRIDATIAGDDPGFAAALDEKQLRLPRAALDDPDQAQQGRGVGLLFLIPGIGETLRINGSVTSADSQSIVIAVQECYLHCAKALLRSDFWRPEQPPIEDAGDFVRSSRFMALATADTELNTDLSPKGDPAGLLAQAFEGGIRYADRPGNRRTDSLRNILVRPQASALLIVPGHTQVARIRGPVDISADPQLRQPFTVRDKTPKLVTSILSPSIELRTSLALARARPWLASAPPADIDPAAIFAAHVRLHKARGLGAIVTKGLVAIPGLMRKSLDVDYKRNLY
ncbi:pyridoxamine 5'-phosphate oxidase family protein [Candidimonas humi]|uniref:Pyridoxamine 5'-phosphate oxidase family protein n=1 Tax=Candidimonas humi TaxID=683355 RepID=A0ABV8NY62_9BURK|nr:pyridoxamine 5'-phosphate oxidase family protein [Candidimonas humi]